MNGEEAFAAYFPKISDADVVGAANTDQIVQSFATQLMQIEQEKIGAVAIKLAIADGTAPVLIVDRYVCSVLKLMIETLDVADWDFSKLPQNAKKLN